MNCVFCRFNKQSFCELHNLPTEQLHHCEFMEYK